MAVFDDSNLPPVQLMVIIALGHNVIIFLYHTSKIFRNMSYIKALSIISMLIMLLMLISLIPNVFALWPTLWNCDALIIGMGEIYMLAKLSIYILFLERLFHVFGNSALEFKPCHIYLSRISIAIWALFMTIILITRANGLKNPQKSTQCLPDVPLYVHGLLIFGDITICTCISILFSRRLIMLNMTIINNEERQIANALMSTKTLELLSKSTLLTFIALSTTVLSLIAGGIIGVVPLFVSLDMMVNVLCIMLMFIVHEELYNFCCAKAQPLVTAKCLRCCSCACFCRITDGQSNVSTDLKLPADKRTMDCVISNNLNLVDTNKKEENKTTQV